VPSIPIIGLGAICGSGTGIDAGFEAVAGGRDDIRPLGLFDCGLKEVPLCGQVTADIDALLGFAAPNKTTGMAMVAALEAMSALPDHRDLRLGIVGATTVGGMTRSEQFYSELLKDPSVMERAAEELSAHEPGAMTGFLGRRLKADGIHTVSTACSSGLHAIGMAMRLINNGVYDLCLAVGSDALCRLTIRGFASLLLLDSKGCRPFDKNRAGISLGEGAGAMLLASEHTCKTLGREPFAFVKGWGASADCHHMTAPHPEGAGARAAIAAALAEACIPAGKVDYLAAHGTATPDNDSAEIAAVRAVFGTVPPFCSMKRTLGHTLAASGTIESVFAVMSLRRGIIPASGGFTETDEKIGAVPSAWIRRPIRTVLKNSFGFGGNNASVVFDL
jgi:3-oxoacyl-(acyl-carrier-protein) synthase